MNYIFIYILQFSIAITLFYGLYLLVLKNETYYKVNRIYLVLGLILAVSLPLFPITYNTPMAILNNADFFSLSDQPVAISKNASTVEQPINSLSFFEFIGLLYLVGVIFFLVKLIWQSVHVASNVVKSQAQIVEGVKVINKKGIMPYSFFNVVFIDIQKYSERELSNIIAHEKVHIRERHWIDLLIIELLMALFWVNPVVWLYERSIKQNHEYLADQGVLLAGYHPGQYQALLINQLMGVKVLGFAHNLNFSLNKKRMEMMKKEKSPRANKMKLLLALPIVGLLVFAFAKNEYVMVNTENKLSGSNLNLEQIDVEADLITVKGKVTDAEGNPMTGANVILKGTNNGTVVDRQGEFLIETPRDFTLVVSFIGYKTTQASFTLKDLEKNDGWVGISMKKSVFNVKLPETGYEEKLIKGDVVEVPPPPPPPKKGNKDEVFTIVEDMPYFGEGGMYQLAQELEKETRWVMEKTKDRGEAVVGFEVAANGNIVDPYIVRSSESKMLDATAVKIIQKLDHWRPGIQRGKRVAVDLTVPVKFY